MFRPHLSNNNLSFRNSLRSPSRATLNGASVNDTSIINDTSSRSGFTMIEVGLVLALAGLIFMMVFIALPNAQMNQRNTNRRNDYLRLSTAISNYTSDNNGRLPKLANVEAKWLNDTGKDPDGNSYTIGGCDYSASGSGCTIPDKLSPSQVNVYFGYNCSGNNGTPANANSSRTFAIYGYVEDGSAAGDTYCLSSNG